MPWIAWGFTLIGTCLLAFSFPEVGYSFLAISLVIQLLVLNRQRKKILPVENKIDPLPLDEVSLKKTAARCIKSRDGGVGTANSCSSRPDTAQY